MTPTFFATQAAWRAWLQKHHDREAELLVGFYKKDCGKPSITWPQSVDEALCFGWIDGVRRRIDDECYSIRFTPRRPRSNWSLINIRRIDELTKLGLVHPSGAKAFEAREAKRSGVYGYETDDPFSFTSAQEKRFRANRAAWRFFSAQAPGYQRLGRKWVVTAIQEATRASRLERLIEISAGQQRIGPMAPLPKSKKTS